MASPEESTSPNEKPNPDSKDEQKQLDPPRAAISGDSTRNIFTSISAKLSTLGPKVRLLVVFGAVILIAYILLWLADKLVFFYLTKSYVDEVVAVLDINKYFARALVFLLFAMVVFFAGYTWSFSKRNRLIAVVGILSLLSGHSVVLGYATRNQYFDPSGKAIKCYVLTRD